MLTMPDGDYPGQSAIDEWQNKCQAELQSYAPDAIDRRLGRRLRPVSHRRDVEAGRPGGRLHRDHRGQADRVAQGLSRSRPIRYLRYRLGHDFGALRRGHRGGRFRAESAQPSSSSGSAIDDFVILDREDDLGGTWHVNHYPGLAVDVPTTTYSYFFEPNPNWSRLFTPGAEIKQYADDVADKYDVRRHMRFNTDGRGRPLGRGGQRLAGRAGRRRNADRALPDHRDGLPVPAARCPTSPASTDFAGKVIHTTAWDDDYRRRPAAASRSSAPAPPPSS